MDGGSHGSDKPVWLVFPLRVRLQCMRIRTTVSEPFFRHGWLQ
jgi:hypothetical protein